MRSVPAGCRAGGGVVALELIDLGIETGANPWLDAADISNVTGTMLKAWEPPPDFSEHPETWLAKVLGEYAWGLQREIWRSVVVNRATSVHSCHDSGKSYIAARIVAWWIATHPGEDAFVVTTAPTAHQVAAILWREVRNAWRKAKDRGQPLPGRIVASPYAQWKIGDKLVGFGRKPADYEQSAFQGIHERYVLVVVDEAGGIVRSLWDAVDSLLTNEHARVLAIGNPDDPAAHFAVMCHPGSDWNVIRIDGLRTPNFSDELTRDYPLVRALMRHEGIPFNTEAVPERIRPMLLSPLWVEERLRRWCGIAKDAHLKMLPDELEQHVAKRAQASALFTAKVRGEFPDGGAKGVIPLGWAQRAVERWKDWDAGQQAVPADVERGLRGQAAIPARAEQAGRRVCGVDVAGEGDDETAVAIRSNNVIKEVVRYTEGDTMDTADNVVVHLANVPQAVAVVDVIGIGAGVRDKLRRDGVATVGFNASVQSDRTDKFGEFRFINDRAAAWWHLRELLDPSQPGGSQIALPDDPQLLQELVAPTWKVRTGSGVGKIQIEEKAEIRKRLGHSTDSADAVVMAFWISGAPLNAWDSAGSTLDWDDGAGSGPNSVEYPEDGQVPMPGDEWERQWLR